MAGLLAGVMLLSGSRTDASPIRDEDLSSADVTAFKEWSRYLKAGPEVWKAVLHPPVTPAVRSMIWEDVKTDPGGTEPMVAYLLWKQSLDPTRFAYYHPKLSPALDKVRAETPPTTTTSVAPQGLNPSSSSGTPSTTTTTTTSPTTTVAPQDLNPPPPAPTPEPSTLLVALGLAGWSIWQARRKTSNP
jgi:hypothetical protein